MTSFYVHYISIVEGLNGVLGALFVLAVIAYTNLYNCIFFQYSKGGPIIAFQIENEYGSYGNDMEYKMFLKKVTYIATYTRNLNFVSCICVHDIIELFLKVKKNNLCNVTHF
jgi:hypothetical protein